MQRLAIVMILCLPVCVFGQGLTKNDAAKSASTNAVSNAIPQTLIKRLFYPNQKQIRAELIGDESNSMMRVYFQAKDPNVERGMLQAEEYYRNGKLDSVRREYFENGQLRAETRFANGLRQGLTREFYENGKLQTEAIYNADTLASPLKVFTYYPNGRIKEETPSNTDGQLHGVRKVYFENGGLESECHYTDGAIDGEFKSYYPDGKMATWKLFKDGKLNGEEKVYSEKGTLVEITLWKNNRKVGKKFYDAQGKLIEELDEREIIRRENKK